MMTLGFTSKERDSESGLDYFGARYFSGAQGRFMSPDWSATPQPVPYADLTDPQTLNLYSYVHNNPLSKRDLDGHADILSTVFDYYTGVGKGVVNGYLSEQGVIGTALQKIGVTEQTPANQAQALGMQDSSTVVAVAVMIGPGPKGLKSGALLDDALVVRGGMKVSDSAVSTHQSGVTGISVESAPGKSVEQLATESPTVSKYGQVRCCTVGDVRAAGGRRDTYQGWEPQSRHSDGLARLQNK